MLHVSDVLSTLSPPPLPHLNFPSFSTLPTIFLPLCRTVDPLSYAITASNNDEVRLPSRTATFREADPPTVSLGLRSVFRVPRHVCKRHLVQSRIFAVVEDAEGRRFNRDTVRLASKRFVKEHFWVTDAAVQSVGDLF